MTTDTETIRYSLSQPPCRDTIRARVARLARVSKDYEKRVMGATGTYEDKAVVYIELENKDEDRLDQTVRGKTNRKKRRTVHWCCLRYKAGANGSVRTLVWQARGISRTRSRIDSDALASIGRVIAETKVHVFSLRLTSHSPPVFMGGQNGNDDICLCPLCRYWPTSEQSPRHFMCACSVSLWNWFNEGQELALCA